MDLFTARWYQASGWSAPLPAWEPQGAAAPLMRGTTERLVKAAQTAAGRAWLPGFYSYDELSPVTDGDCALHNQTMTITVLRERPA